MDDKLRGHKGTIGERFLDFDANRWDCPKQDGAVCGRQNKVKSLDLLNQLIRQNVQVDCFAGFEWFKCDRFSACSEFTLCPRSVNSANL